MRTSGKPGLAAKKLENQRRLNHVTENEKEINIKSHPSIFKQINIPGVAEWHKAFTETIAGSRASFW